MQKSILIVEDERPTAWALAQSLSEDGYFVQSVETAEDALNALDEDPADLVITDLRLPGMSGLDLVRRLGRRHRPIPAIVITAHGDPSLHASIAAERVRGLFVKPFHIDDVKRCVVETWEPSREAVGE
jgi:DNA-binding NtrC family response regulator